jgi:hypothetical protein
MSRRSFECVEYLGESAIRPHCAQEVLMSAEYKVIAKEVTSVFWRDVADLGC